MLDKTKVKIYSSILRMGVAGSYVDNASSGGITCGIQDLPSGGGQLNEFGFYTNGDKLSMHPDSKISFSDVVIPGFNKIKTMVQKLHPCVPMFRLISWDFALDTDNCPVLIEANYSFGEIDFHQLNNGPLFGEDIFEILDEIIKSPKKINY